MTHPISRRWLFGAAAALPFAAAAPAAARMETAEEMKTDFAWLARYADDNAALIASGKPVGVVFMGDSITEGWHDKHPQFFADTGHVCRGIGGQTTPQMVLRMMADVVHLKPKAVHIMAGTNDIAGNTGPMTHAQTQDNLRMMTEIAQAAGIHVLLASIPPSAGFPWKPGLEVPDQIHQLNQWIEGYALGVGATWVDYYPVLADAAGGMKPGLAVDGVHPTARGYDAMERQLQPILARLNLP